MEKYRFLRPLSRGFTLIELMVTVAVLVIVGLIAAPNLQSFVARTGMQTLEKDFIRAIARARSEAVARNTCVSMCQLNVNTTTGATTCETNSAIDGEWQQGWIIFENPTCQSPTGTSVPTAEQIIQIRQPGSMRYTLKDKASTDRQFLTFNARGMLSNQGATFETADTQDASSIYRRKLVLSMQGRVVVDAGTTVPATAAGNK
jgi:type IV fimbrial biogenesis protein FimT